MDIENEKLNERKADNTRRVDVLPSQKFSKDLGVNKFKDFFNNRKTGQQKETYFITEFGAKPIGTTKNELFPTKEEWNEGKYIHDNIIAKIIPKSIIEHRVGSDLDLKNKKVNLELYSFYDEETGIYESSPLYAISLIRGIFIQEAMGTSIFDELLKYIDIKSVEAIIPIDGLGIVGYQLRQALLDDEDTYVTGTYLLNNETKSITYNFTKNNAVSFEVGKERVEYGKEGDYTFTTLNPVINSVTAKFCGAKTFKIKDTKLQKDHVVIDLYGKPGIINTYDFGTEIKHSVLIKYSITLSEILSIPSNFWEKRSGYDKFNKYLDYILDVVFSPNTLLTFDKVKLDFIKTNYKSANISVSPNSLLAKRIEVIEKVCPKIIGVAIPGVIVDKKKITPYMSLFQKCIDFAKSLKGAYLKGSSTSLNIKLAEFFNQRFTKAKKKSKTNYTSSEDYNGIVIKSDDNEKILGQIALVNSKIPLFLNYIDDLVAKTKADSYNLIFNYDEYTKGEILDDIDPYLKFLYGEKEQWGYTSIIEWIKQNIRAVGDKKLLPYDVNNVKTALSGKLLLLKNKRENVEEKIKSLIELDPANKDLSTQLRTLRNIKTNLLKDNELWRKLNNLEALNPVQQQQLVEEVQNNIILDEEVKNNDEILVESDAQKNELVKDLNEMQRQNNILINKNVMLQDKNILLTEVLEQNNVNVPISQINMIDNDIAEAEQISIFEKYSHIFGGNRYWGMIDYSDYYEFVKYVYIILMSYNHENVQNNLDYCKYILNYGKLEAYFNDVKTQIDNNISSKVYSELIEFLITGGALSSATMNEWIDQKSIQYGFGEDEEGVVYGIEDIEMNFNVNVQGDKKIDANIIDEWGDTALKAAIKNPGDVVRSRRRNNVMKNVADIIIPYTLSGAPGVMKTKIYDTENMPGKYGDTGNSYWGTLWGKQLKGRAANTLTTAHNKITFNTSTKGKKRAMYEFNQYLAKTLVEKGLAKEELRQNNDDSTDITKNIRKK